MKFHKLNHRAALWNNTNNNETLIKIGNLYRNDIVYVIQEIITYEGLEICEVFSSLGIGFIIKKHLKEL